MAVLVMSTVPRDAWATHTPSLCPGPHGTIGQVRHWEKIIVVITDSSVARQFGVPHNSELDIKVLDDPEEVADLKGKVRGFLTKLTQTPL